MRENSESKNKTKVKFERCGHSRKRKKMHTFMHTPFGGGGRVLREQSN